jgi:hypothetical protein
MMLQYVIRDVLENFKTTAVPNSREVRAAPRLDSRSQIRLTVVLVLELVLVLVCPSCVAMHVWLVCLYTHARLRQALSPKRYAL